LVSDTSNFPSIATISPEEHEYLLNHMTRVTEQDLGEVVLRAGISNGRIVVLFNTMSGQFGVVSGP